MQNFPHPSMKKAGFHGTLQSSPLSLPPFPEATPTQSYGTVIKTSILH